MIPKIVHYCWLSNDKIPNNLQEYMKSWEKYLPNYEFVKWDFSKFDKNSSEWVSEAFKNKKYAFACDYIRLYALYNHGGIYMDMDIEVLKSFDELLQQKRMMAKERPDELWIEAGCLGAEKGDEFLAECLKYYKNKHFVNEKGIFEDTPLPRIMAKVYKEKGFGFDLYDWHTFTNKSYYTGKIDYTDNSYTIHHFAGSWKSKEEQFIVNKVKIIRNEVPLVGNALAFLFEKGFKTKEALKKSGIRGFFIRLKRYIRKS